MEQDKLNEFRDAVDSLKIKSGAPDRDKLYQRLGAALMVAGIVLAFVAYFLAGAQNSGDLAVDNIEHNEHIVLAICGMSIAIVGAATFLKFGITRFMRFWLIRKIYEDRKP